MLVHPLGDRLRTEGRVPAPTASISTIQPVGRSLDRFGIGFDGSKIREAGFEQPVSNEEALRRTAAWHLRAVCGEALPEMVA